MTRLVPPFTLPTMFVLLALGGAGAALWQALQRWHFERWCAMTCPPFWDAAGVDALRAAMDWRTPLALAVLALGVAALAWRVGRPPR